KIYRNTGTAGFKENRIYKNQFSEQIGSGSAAIAGSFSLENTPGSRALSELRYNLTLGADFAPLQSTRPIQAAAAVSVSSNRITITAHGLLSGDQISFAAPASGASLPGGLTANRLYWVRAVDANTIELLPTSNTTATAVDLTSTGSGLLAWRLHGPVSLGPDASPVIRDLIDQSQVSVNADGSSRLIGAIRDSAALQAVLSTGGLRLAGRTPTGTVALSLTPDVPEGLSEGAVAIGDLDGDGDNDVVISGFGNLNRRTATGAIVPVPELRVYQTVEASRLGADGVGVTILREVSTTLPGLARGSIELADVNGDARLDLIVTGEDLFVDDNPERFDAQEQVGGNPNTSIFLNRSLQRISAKENVDTLFKRLVVPGHGLSNGADLTVTVSSGGSLPGGLSAGRRYYVKALDANNIQLFSDAALSQVVAIESKGSGLLTLRTSSLPFQNAIFPANANDSRWASFDYRFPTDGLSPGVYALRAVPLDHARSDVILEPLSGLPALVGGIPRKLNGSTLRGTATENLFVLANTAEDFYDVNQSPVVIEGFNPFMDRLQLRRGPATPIISAIFSQFDLTTDQLLGDHGFEVGRVVPVKVNRVLAELPTGLEEERIYFVKTLDSSTMELYEDPGLSVKVNLRSTGQVAVTSVGRFSFDVRKLVGQNVLEIYRVQDGKAVVRLPGLSELKDIKISTAFSQGNVVFADYTQAENPFILSPVNNQLRDASAQTGFIVTDHGDASNQTLSPAEGFSANLASPEVSGNFFVRLLRRLGVDLSRPTGALTGAGGNDSLSGGSRGPDLTPVTYLDGGSGDDRLRGSNMQGAIDLLLGGEGNDALVGLAGRNLLFGQAGDDSLVGGLNEDSLFGGSGEDLLDGADATDTADYSQSRLGGIRIDLSRTNSYRGTELSPRILVSQDGDGNEDWITLAGDYLLTTLAAAEISIASSTLRIPSHGLPDGARIRLRPRQGSTLPLGRIGTADPVVLNGTYYVKAQSVAGNIRDFIALYQDRNFSQKITITAIGVGSFDLLGDVSSIEAVVGSGFDDVIIGDRQRNILRGGAGQDSLDGGLDRDQLDGGSGNDTLKGGEGSDTLIGGGGQDLLIGGTGDDIYIIGSELLTLEQAFEALGGRLSDLAPIPTLPNNPARSKPITYEQFVLLADANRWASVDGKPQFERFRALGLEPDLMLFERAKLDPSQGWLRVAPGGSRIEAGVVAFAGNDVAYLDLDRLISLQGLQVGQVGLAQSGTNLVIDVNRDGIAEDGVQRSQLNQSSQLKRPLGQDVTIKDFFKSSGTEAGENDVSLRLRGLQATYYDDTEFRNVKLERVDRQLDFSWAASAGGSDALRPIDGDFAVIWDGILQPSTDGNFRFQLNIDQPLKRSEKDSSGKLVENDYNYEVFVDERRLVVSDTVALKSSEPVRIRVAFQLFTPAKPVKLQLEWALGNQPFQPIAGDQLSTSQTIVANDVLARSREFVPELSDLATNVGAQITGYRQASDWSSQVRLADFDGDGLPDLLLQGRDAMGQAVAAIYGNRPQSLRVVDVVANTVDPATNQLRLPGHGLSDGDEIRFEAPVAIGDQLPDGLEPNTSYLVRRVTADLIALRSPGSAKDLDLTGSGSGRIRYLAPADRFTLADPNARIFALSGYDELVAVQDVDLDQDGDVDLVALVRNAFSDGETISRRNELLAYLNDGSGKFSITPLPQDLSALPTSGELRPLFADLDTDGRVDLAVAWDGDTNTDGALDSTNLRLWYSAGRSLLQSSAAWQRQQEPRAFLGGTPTAVDLNADGQLELILSGSSSNPNTYVRKGVLDGQTLDGRSWSGSERTYGERLRLADELTAAGITRANGKRYRVSLTSTDFDTYLELMQGPAGDDLFADGSADQQLFDDDGGTGRNSEFIFTDDGSSDPYLRISSYSPLATGRYSLSFEELNQRTVLYRLIDGELWPLADIGSPLTSGADYALPADVDLDGVQELLLGGAAGSSLAAVNPSNLALRKTLEELGAIAGGPGAAGQWIDQDNDGDLDLFLTLQTDQGPVSRVLRNPVIGDATDTTFQQLGTLLPGLVNASAAWADVDGDTDLDLVLSGGQGRSAIPYLQLFRNTTVDRDRDGNRTGTQNLAPLLNLGGFQAAMVSGDASRLRLSWRELFPTGEEPYTTNLRLGTSKGGNNIITSLALGDGRRLVSQSGNNGFA
ncbi:MAG: FG-GAP-like repeat-containing protein, partial [Cyanobacteriota bacterium]|nr:FG-GAP-like repeat-containing protein [Cyanobacteriota bacterium]